MKVFVSSTVFDLLDVRAELENMLKDLGASPVLSDSSTSDFLACPNRNSIETCLINVRQSDALIVVLSQRYGTSLKTAGYPDISATHLEYREAIKNKVPIHFFVRDRLESDYRIWKKNRRQRKGIKLSWIADSGNHRLFDFIHEHQKLAQPKQRTNWYTTFRNSVELKQLVRRDLALPLVKAALERAIRENHMPIFDGHMILSPLIKQAEHRIATCHFRNVGTVPAYNLLIQRSADTNHSPSSYAKTLSRPVLAPGSEVIITFKVTIPGPGVYQSYHLTYQTPEGHKVKDTFESSVSVKGKLWLKRFMFKDRSYKAGEGLPVTISV